GIGKWLSTQDMPFPADNHTATLLPDGNVLVAGGFSNGVYQPKAAIYISTAGVWQSIPDMGCTQAQPNAGAGCATPVARAEHTATLLQDGRVLITGGINATGVLCTSQLFDPFDTTG